MASVEKEATLVVIAENTTFNVPADNEGNIETIETMTLVVVLDKGTPAEQRINFMIRDSDYEALGMPSFGETLTITLATVTPAAHA